MTVLCIAAHPDDEILGAGGTLALHATRDKVYVFLLTNGTGARAGDGEERVRMAKAACAAIGAELWPVYTFPDQRMDGVDILDVTQSIEAVMRVVKPDTVYTHHFGDRNKDHRVVHDAAMTACRPVPGASVKRIYGFEVPSSTEWGHGFVPTRFVDISSPDIREAKREALKAYEIEMRAFPHPRSMQAIDALQQVRGATVGVFAAEAFMVLREIA